jgi:hypothetical protein
MGSLLRNQPSLGFSGMECFARQTDVVIAGVRKIQEQLPPPTPSGMPSPDNQFHRRHQECAGHEAVNCIPE